MTRTARLGVEVLLTAAQLLSAATPALHGSPAIESSPEIRTAKWSRSSMRISRRNPGGSVLSLPL